MRARYLVGADGAKSKVMDDAGLKVEGQLARAATAYVLFRADLTRYVAHRPSILYWIVTSNAAFGEIGMGLLRAIEPWNQWIAGWGFDMTKGEPDFSPEEIKRKVRVAGGRSGAGDRDRQHVGLVRQPGPCAGLLQGSRLLRRRCGAPPSAVERPGLEHLHAGRLQPGLEAGVRGEGACRRAACWTPTRWSARRSARRS